MGRLIELQDMRTCPASLTLRSGDVLLVHAPGGHVRSGSEVVEILGPLVPAVLGLDGSILSPVGPPNTVLFRALQPGRARIEIVTGDPFHKVRKTELGITVEDVDSESDSEAESEPEA